MSSEYCALKYKDFKVSTDKDLLKKFGRVICSDYAEYNKILKNHEICTLDIDTTNAKYDVVYCNKKYHNIQIFVIDSDANYLYMLYVDPYDGPVRIALPKKYLCQKKSQPKLSRFANRPFTYMWGCI